MDTCRIRFDRLAYHLLANRSGRLRWLLVFALLIVLALRLGLGGEQDTSLRRVQQAGVLVVALDASYPPFETTDGRGNFGGFDVALGREIARRLGVQAQFANISFDNLYDALAGGKADVVISGLRYEAERTRDVIYTTPYFDAGQVFIVRSGDSAGKPADLAGRRVAVETASETEVELQKLRAKLTGLQIRGYETREDGLTALRRNEVDALATDRVSALSMIKNQTDVRLILPPFAPDLLVAAGNIRDRTLMNEINRILRALRDEGIIARLEAQSF